MLVLSMGVGGELAKRRAGCGARGVQGCVRGTRVLHGEGQAHRVRRELQRAPRPSGLGSQCQRRLHSWMKRIVGFCGTDTGCVGRRSGGEVVSDVVSDARYRGSVGSYARHGRRLGQRYKEQKGFSFGTRGSERVYGETLCASLTSVGLSSVCLSVCLQRLARIVQS